MSSRAQKSNGSRSWVGVLAAVLMVLQGLLGAAQTARALDLAALDRQIHLTLCAPGSESDLPAGDGADSALPGCCLAACLLSAAVPLPPSPPAAQARHGETAAIDHPGADDAPERARLRIAAPPRGPPFHG